MATLSVDEALDRSSRRRFLEVPWALHGREPRWAPPLVTFERRRLDRRLNPFFEEGDAALLLVRRGGRVIGRVSAHVAHDGDEQGRFGFFDVDDDADAARALLDEARAWLAARGCPSIIGPVSFTREHEAGVLVEGFDVPGVTGRQWHPPHDAAFLEAAGFDVTERFPSYRLRARGDESALMPASLTPPDLAGSYADPALLLTDGSDGEIAAVPDLASALRGAGMRSACPLARVARNRAWETCVVVRVHGDAGTLVPGLCGAAGAAGYTSVVSPWAPDDRAPEAVHALFR